MTALIKYIFREFPKKGGQTIMKIKMVFSIIAVIAVALSLTPGVAFAATTGTSSGSFQCGNVAPTVNSITCNWSTTMTPQAYYQITLDVTDANTLNDLDTITVYIYYDANGEYNTGDRPGSGNVSTCAILEWENPSTWTIDPSASTTWGKVESNCSVPTLSASNGNFIFAFQPGKVARETPGADEWHIYVVADDGTATGDNYKENQEMAWYGEITVNTGSVNWESVNPNQDFQEGDPSEEGSISVKYVANGAYDEKVAASSSWTGAPSGTAALDAEGTPSANEFSLKADDTGTLPSGSDGLVTASPAYITIDNAGDFTAEAGDTQTNNALWLKLGTPFTSATYSGTIYYQIADGS